MPINNNIADRVRDSWLAMQETVNQLSHNSINLDLLTLNSLLRTASKIKSIRSVLSLEQDATSSFEILTKFSLLSSYYISPRCKVKISDPELLDLNLSLLFNEFMRDISSRKVTAEHLRNPALIKFVIEFPANYYYLDKTAYLTAIFFILGIHAANEKSESYRRISKEALSLFKKSTSTCTNICVKLLIDNLHDKYITHSDKHDFIQSIVTTMIEFLSSNEDVSNAEYLINKVASNKIGLYNQDCFRRVLMQEFAAGKPFKQSTLGFIYENGLAFVHPPHLRNQFMSFADRYLGGALPDQFNEEVLNLLDRGQLKTLAMLRLHSGSDINHDLTNRIIYALRTLLLKPNRISLDAEQIKIKIAQLIASAKASNKDQISLRVFGLCQRAEINTDNTATICSDFNLVIERVQSGWRLIEQSIDGYFHTTPFDERNIGLAAKYLINRSQLSCSKAIKELGFNVDQLFVVPELSELQFSNTQLRRAITPTRDMLDEKPKNSPFRRTKSYPLNNGQDLHGAAESLGQFKLLSL